VLIPLHVTVVVTGEMRHRTRASWCVFMMGECVGK